MTSTHECPGCNKLFKNLDLHQARQAAGTRCRLALERQNDLVRDASATEGQNYEGYGFCQDYFGMDYGEQDFPMDIDASTVQLEANGLDSDTDGDNSDENSRQASYSPLQGELYDDDDDDGDDDDDERRRLGEVVGERRAAQAKLLYRPARVIKFNDVIPDAGAGITVGEATEPGLEQGNAAYSQFALDVQSLSRSVGVYAPFLSKMDWEVACWAKTRGTGSNALDELLGIEGEVVERLGLSYRNARELNEIIDKEIPSRRPAFRRREIEVGETTLEMHCRDTMECIRALFGAPEFADELILQPERHFADGEGQIPVYHDMHTGDWWWKVQEGIERRKRGGTVVPVILSLDKTQITLFRTKSAYPVYLTIGNIPKDVRKKPSRQAQVLLAYLPTSRLQHVGNKASRRRMLLNLVHACLSFLVSDLVQYGAEGVVMKDGNGEKRRCHPVVAAIAVDYQEQVQVTGITSGDCPKCLCPNANLGDDCREVYDRRDMKKVREIMDLIDTNEFSLFTSECDKNRIKPIIHPFWLDLPYFDVYRAITPDILHQLLQGVVKHLIEWLTSMLGEDELDARCRRIPPNHCIRVFHMGLSVLNRVSGTEHSQICRFLVGLLAGFQLDSRGGTRQLIRATRAILDFVYIAQYPIHTSQTLELLDDALSRFHENKEVFIEEGARIDFNFIKLHFMVHYSSSIKTLGTTDNHNTQFTERLHIDFAKDAYAATNRKDELPQMTRWLERKEKVCTLKKNIDWTTEDITASPPWDSTELLPDLEIMTSKNPLKNCTMDMLGELYGAKQFATALARYAVSVRHPNMRERDVERSARDEVIIVRLVSVFERVKFRNLADGGTTVDSIHARAGKLDKQGRDVLSRFDTALVRIREGSGIQSFRVAQVRVIFTLNVRALHQLFLDDEYLRARVPSRLAYVEWFTKFLPQPDVNLRMYKVSRSFTSDGNRECSIIPVSRLYASAHLIPRFGTVAPVHWTSGNVLEECTDFYFNDFKDRSTHFSMF